MSTPISIALCTDTHSWTMAAPVAGAEGNVLYVNHAERLYYLLLDELARSGAQLAIHLGDMINGGGYFNMPASAFAPQLLQVHEGLTQLPFPVYALPGNHDCVPGGDMTLLDGLPSDGLPSDGPGSAAGNGHVSSAWRRFEQLWQLEHGLGRTLDVGVARLVLVNTQGHSATQVAQALPSDPVYGWLADAELARVEAALAGAGTRPVLLFMHQLLRPWQAARTWQEFFGVANGARLLALLEQYGNVRAVFQGHAHFYEVQHVPLAGRLCPFVVAPSVIEWPHAWLRLTLDEAGCSLQLQPLAAGLAAPAGQEWRAGHLQWANWRFAWEAGTPG